MGPDLTVFFGDMFRLRFTNIHRSHGTTMSLRKNPWPLALASLLTAGTHPTGGAAQQCPEGQVSTIEIERLDVFELQDFEEGSFLRGVFRTANKLHMNTSESFIRSDLLFEEGDCFDPFLLEESERILRGRPFIKWAVVTSQTQPDGNVAVHVQVQDDWTLELGLGLSFDEGINLEEILLQETNLLGRGVTVGVGRVQAREVLENFLKLGATRLLGSQWILDAKGGSTRQGPFIEEEIRYPFTSELGTFAVSQAFTFREDYFPYSTSGVENPTHVLVPYKRVLAQLTFAHRFGEPGNLWSLGGGLSREELEFPEGPDSVRIVLDGEFGDLSPATEAEIAVISTQASPLSATRLNLFGGFRNIKYVLREGLDGVRAPQDVMVGSEVTASLNPSLPVLAAEDDAEDLHGRIDIFWASAPGSWVFSTDLRAEGRYVWNAEGGPEGWRDILSEVNLRAYLKPEWLEGHTLFGRVTGARSWNMDRLFQLLGGGREGVRGYSQDAFPGGRRVLGSLEDRFPILTSEVVDVGMALFGDLGKVWGQDVPYGVDSGWRSSVGVGFRVNTPGRALRTMRIDFTLPLSGDRETQGVYFRLYTELGGLLQSPKRPGQVERSRWSGINTDMTVSRSTGG